MSFTKELIIDLSKYLNDFPSEKTVIERCFSLLNSNQNEFNVFDRKCFQDGHFTTSAIVLNSNKNKILLTHHKFLNKWFQLGGHYERDKSFLESAIREVKEESGINQIIPIKNEIFDIDIHKIPENKSKNEPEHFHYDIRFLLQANTEEFTISDESNELQWMTFEDAKKYCKDDMTRMIDKFFEII